MTLTLTPPEPTLTPPPAPRERRAPRALAWAVLVGGAALGTLGVGLSYRLSADGAAPNLYYGVFWIGMLLAVLPVAVRMFRRDVGDGERYLLVALLGLVTWMPKFLRNPFAPAYHDEYAHWRQLLDVLADGRLMHPNSQIPIIQFFPGTSALTAMVQRITGLSPWASGILLLGVMHLLVLAGIVVLGRIHLGTARAGGIAALVYALNPSELFFDTQYAYEGVALAFLVWVLVFTSLAARNRGRARVGLLAAALLTAAGMIVTHHLSTVFLLVFLLVAAVAASIRRGSGAVAWWSALVGVAALALAWISLVARPTLAYLEPYFGGSLVQLGSLPQGSGRTLLAPTVQPVWERVLTAGAPVVLLAVVVVAGVLLRRGRGGLRPDTMGLMAVGLLYFPAVLFLLAPSGAEGARRSWAFSFLSLALLAAFVAERITLRGKGRQAIALALFAVVLIGGVGSGLNDPYRFPGPFRWGTDTRSASDEARSVATALAGEAGRVRVVADRYTGMQLSAYGGLWVATSSAGFPAWALVQTDRDPGPQLAGELSTSNYDYLVVDTRMTEQPSFNGDNFGPTDPLLGQATPAANLARLDHVPWAQRIMTTDHIRVYRLDLAQLGTPLESAP